MYLKRVVVTGSLAYDYIMSMPGKFSEHIMPDKIHIINVSFIMNTFQREYGGTGGNIAYSLSLLGVPVLLVGALGSDAKDYQKHLKKLGIDLSAVKTFKDKTARGFVTTDSDDNQIWGFYEGAMKFSSKIKITEYFQDGDLLVVAPNDPKAMMKYVKEAVKNSIPYLFDPAFNIPHFMIDDLIFAIENAEILIGNDYEIHLIKKRLKEKNSINSLDKLKLLITTLGSRGSIIEYNKKKFKISPAKPKNINDPTGAGDAFRAGFISGLFYKKDLKMSGRMGAIASVYTVEKYGTQTHFYHKTDFQKRYEQNYSQKLNL